MKNKTVCKQPLRLVFLGLCIAGLQACSGGGTPNPNVCILGDGGDVTISGQASFDRVGHLVTGGLDFNNITSQPVKAAVVEVICGNGAISSTVTSDNGSYSLAVPGGTANVLIRVKAQMLKSGTPSWDVAVNDESQIDELTFAMDSTRFNVAASALTKNLHAGSGWGGSSYTGTRVAGPFAILDTIYSAMQFTLTADANLQFPALDVEWSATSTTGSFYTNNTISLLGRTNDTEEFDQHVIAHEWGHYFVDAFSRDDSVGGAHSGSDILDIRVAFSEGFGNAFSAMVTGDAIYKDSFDISSANGLRLDIESNACGTNDGWFSECSIQSIIYDLFDNVSDSPDSISLGFTPIYTALVSAANTEALTSLFSFIDRYKIGANDTAVDALLTGQSIESITDDVGTGMANHLSADDVLVLPVFATGASPYTLCSTGEFQGQNGLSVSRFVQFTVPTTGAYRIEANRAGQPGLANTDPDMILFSKGVFEAFTFAGTANTDTIVVTLTAGVYVLSIFEDAYTDPEYATVNNDNDRACFDITITN